MLAARGARFALPEVTRGIMPGGGRSAVSADPAERAGALAHLQWLADCTAALGGANAISVLPFTAALGLLVPVAGYAGDVLPRKWIVAASLFVWSAATLLTGFGSGLAYLIVVRSLATAGGEAFYAPAGYSLLAQFHQKTRALAMGIDRDQMNETFWLGLATPGSVVCAESMPENPGAEWRKKWSTLDVAAAKISVNPRYGAFDIATGQMSAKTPNWIAGSGQEPAADGSQEPATDGSGGTQEPTPAG